MLSPTAPRSLHLRLTTLQTMPIWGAPDMARGHPEFIQGSPGPAWCVVHRALVRRQRKNSHKITFWLAFWSNLDLNIYRISPRTPSVLSLVGSWVVGCTRQLNT
jgi:hypothetical protein